MDFQLFKEIKIKGLFIKMVITLFLGIVIMILSKLCKIAITDNYIEVISFAITTVWFLLIVEFIKKNNMHLSSFVKKPSRRGFIFEIPVTLIVTYIGGIGVILLMLFLVNYINPNILSSLQSKMVDRPHDINTAFIKCISFATSVIVAPITEEYIFRGILMNRLYNKYGMGKSIIFSSLIFLMAHITPNPMLLFLGISCAILVYKYKSLIPAILLHASNNLITFIRNSSSTVSQGNDLTVNSSFLVIGIILLIIYVLYAYINYRKYKI